MTNSDTLIALENAGYFTDNRWLVEGITMSVTKGEIVTLIGPNGGGKSTTVKLALGLLKQSKGQVFRHPKLKIGYMPQKLLIDWSMPLRVNRLMQMSEKASNKQIEAALDRVGVLHLKRQEAQALSGGEMQRVLLARAFLHKPDLLVLDEPVQGVDFKGEVLLYNLITEIRDETQCGILMISHDLHVVMASTDKVICLNGHICCQGSPLSLESSPDYARFKGTQFQNSHAVYTHSHNHQHGLDGKIIHDCDENKAKETGQK